MLRLRGKIGFEFLETAGRKQIFSHYLINESKPISIRRCQFILSLLESVA
jgi:hypothetical protein